MKTNSIIRQAILIRRLPATNCKPSRYKASCARGSIIQTNGFEGAEIEVRATLQALLNKLVAEDLKAYKIPEDKNPWAKGTWVIGGLPNGDYAATHFSQFEVSHF